MRKLLIILSLSGLSGCATPDQQAKSLLQTLEWDENESGTLEIEGNLSLSNIPFVSSTVHVKLTKSKIINEVSP